MAPLRRLQVGEVAQEHGLDLPAARGVAYQVPAPAHGGEISLPDHLAGDIQNPAAPQIAHQPPRPLRP